jgi:glycosyltransferase involved in cell wall biosynthesis
MIKKNKKLLIVTYVFPPFAAVGGFRIIKFCKYLRRFGIEPIILTPANPNTVSKDEGLLDQIPEDLSVYRTFTFEPFRWKRSDKNQKNNHPQGFAVRENSVSPKSAKPSPIKHIKKIIRQNLSIPDGSYFWSWTGLMPGLKIVKQKNIDAVLSSSPPNSVHLLGSRIARLSGLPHIVDFRDLWTQNTNYRDRALPAYLQRRDRRYEKKVLLNAAGITVNTASFQKQILDNNSALNDERVIVVTNGVDPDDFSNLLVERKPNIKFTMLYIGSLYGSDRNPEFFFTAVQKWLNDKPELASQIKIQFIGNLAPEYGDLPERHKLGGIVEYLGWLPQQQALAATFSADLLLLFQGFNPALTAAVPRKLYEYMITNRPIMAFAPPGEIPDQPIIEFLGKSFAEWDQTSRSDQITTVNLRDMPELETAGQIEKLAELCFAITNRSN